MIKRAEAWKQLGLISWDYKCQNTQANDREVKPIAEYRQSLVAGVASGQPPN